MAGTGAEPDIENIVLFPERSPFAFGACVLRWNEFFRRAFEPDVGRMLREQIHCVVQNLAFGEWMAAGAAVEHHDGHTPNALAGDAPVRPRPHHVAHALFTP